jgi:predicted PurR-regulated permease PerM
MGDQFGSYVSGTLVNGAIVAMASIVPLWFLRGPYPIVLGLLQGLLVSIPYLGTLIGVLTAGAVVFAAQGWLSAAVAMASIALVATLEGSFIAPLMFKKSPISIRCPLLSPSPSAERSLVSAGWYWQFRQRPSFKPS